LAGRLANEDARALSTLHEALANDLAESFDAYFGTPVEVRFDAIKQSSVKDYVAEVSPFSYILPFPSPVAAVEFDLNLAFPMIELLMGGPGDIVGEDRALSEIEEEMMQDIVSLVMHRVKANWDLSELTIVPGSRIKPSGLLQLLRPTEKVTLLRFEVKVVNASGSFSLLLSTPLLDLLVKKLKSDRTDTKSRMFSFPAPPLRERILDCGMEVTAELTELKVPVKDLVSLELGSVLKLHAPIRMSATVTLAGRGMFEAVPVRSGRQRAAQLGRRLHSTDWKRR
jgi:flagellar motor switch protein FliM